MSARMSSIPHALHLAARGLALAGGAVLLALVVLTCLSVGGMALLKVAPSAPVGPVRGEYELIEAGAAIVVCLMLPWCQLHRAHASVDLIAGALRPGANAALLRLWDGVAALMLALLAWRLGAGMVGKWASHEQTFLLRLPLWWGYAACLPGLGLAALVAAVQALGLTGRDGGRA